MVEKATGALWSFLDGLSKGWPALVFLAAVAAFYFNTTNQISNLTKAVEDLSSSVLQLQTLDGRVHTLEDKSASRDDVLRSIQSQQGEMASAVSSIGNQLATLSAQTTLMVNQVFPGGHPSK
jgi:hypothetical protein